MLELMRYMPVFIRSLHVVFMFAATDCFATRLGFPVSVGTTIVVTIFAVFLSDLFRKYFESRGEWRA
jgi:phosphate/sulfate permease